MDILFEIQDLIPIAQKAGELIMSFYQEDNTITGQNALSPITKADLASHHYIKTALLERYPTIPILSEEAKENHAFECRKDWEYFFLIDPLDGTKEFIKKNDEFAINIALIQHDAPILGIIYAPALDLLYFAQKNQGAYKQQAGKTIKLSTAPHQQPIRALHSRSHHNPETEKFLDHLKQKGNDVTLVPVGSSLKFGWLAENLADIYPRFGPTMEWDTAAGDIIVKEAGKKIQTVYPAGRLHYNKKSLINPAFIVE